MEGSWVELYCKDSVYALEQMRKYQGIGDILEDDVEYTHQVATRIEARTTQMKGKAQQAFVIARRLKQDWNCLSNKQDET
jgi:hypothetical protein